MSSQKIHNYLFTCDSCGTKAPAGGLDEPKAFANLERHWGWTRKWNSWGDELRDYCRNCSETNC